MPTSPVSLRSALSRRAAVVAGSAAAAALFATVPAPPAAAPVAPASPVVTAPVVRLAATKPAAITLNPQAIAAAAAPAAVRRSAMQKALGKVGSPYRYGAAGPNAFDCSGLVSWAFKNSGKSLPRSSRAMSRVGTPVSKAALQPGDLVFFYKPVSHVAIYIGDGKVVHASTRKSPVKISNLNAMTFTSARRI